MRVWGGGRSCSGVGAQGLGLSSQLLAAPIFRPVRRTRQARVVLVFSGCSLAAGGGWGFRAGLTEPLSGHGALLRGAGGDRACLTGRVVVRYARNSCGVIYFTACKLYTYETCHMCAIIEL